MNKQKFIELLNNPGDLKEVNLNELDDLVAENPYFQAARVLEAKGHRLLKSKVAGRKTASAAVYSTNRILLKKYLAGDGIKVEKPVVSSPKPIEEKPKPFVRPVETKVEQTPTPTPTPQASEVPSPEATQVPEPSEGSSSIDQLIYNLHKDMEELEKSRAKYIEVSRKIEEEEAVEKAVKKATRVTEKAEPKPKAETAKTTTGSSGAATKAKATTTKKATGSRTKTAGEKKSTTKKATTSKSATKSVAKPKASTSKAATAKKTTTKSSTRKTSPKTTAKKSSSKTSKTTKSTKSTKKDDHDGENQHQLIDEFIKNNPSFKPAQESGEQQDLSAQSTALPEDIGTEYLAEIFLNQGKKDKALKIYNSLMLRFPEKKAYFAGRIKKIK